MEKDYVIQMVSRDEPRVWPADKKNMLEYKVKLRDQGDNIYKYSRYINSPAPMNGDIVKGTIVENSQYGDTLRETYKPKAGGSKPNYVPRDDAAIQSQWALGQTVTFYLAHNEAITGDPMNEIELLAKQFFAMIPRVKSSNDQPEAKPIGAIAAFDGFSPVDDLGNADPSNF